MKRCGAESTNDSVCLLPEMQEHLDHLDAAGRTWPNASIIRTHDRRRDGEPLSRAREIASHARRASTARYSTDGLPKRSP